MTDQEEGFAFVDKRGTRADAAAGENPSTADASTSQTENQAESSDSQAEDQAALQSALGDAEEDDLSGEEAPDTYSLISYCVSLLASDAWQKLGLIAGPKAGDAQADLKQAKVAIDAVGELAAHLEAAPPEAMPENLRRELRVLIQDLRLNFVAQQIKSN